MSRVAVKIETNVDDGVKTTKELTGKIPESADDAAKIIAHSWIREAQRTMQGNSSVVTGTGIRSFRTMGGRTGEQKVFGADYLNKLDEGTSPHHPDTKNYRFIKAAQSYGMSRQALAETIAQKGTDPHPWIAKSTARLRKSAPERVKISLRQGIQESLSRYV